MRAPRLLAVLSLSTFLVGAAQAQPAPLPEPGQEEAPTAPPAEDAPRPLPPPPVDLQLDDARARYDRAFALVLGAQCEAALPLLLEVAGEARDPELRGAANALRALCRAQLAAAAPGGARPSLLGEADKTGRFSFVSWATLIGLGLGFELDMVVQPPDVASNVAIVLATTGLAFGSSLYWSRDQAITLGEASLLGSGFLFGTYNAVLLGIMFGAEVQGAGLLAILGTSVGSATGFLTARHAALSAGDASLIGSGGLWGTIAGLLFLPIIQPWDTASTTFTMLLPVDVGLLAAALAASSFELSRDRVLLMDLGALLGGLGLGGIGLILADTLRLDGDGGPIAAMALTGMVAGGALSLWLTRDLDLGKAPALGSLLRVDGLELTLGSPLPLLLPDPTRAGGLMVFAPLASGRF